MNILITGAGSGIGAGIARSLAQAAHHVIVSDRDNEMLIDLAKNIRQEGYQATPLALDVTSHADLSKLETLARELRLDAVINNAGIQHVSRLEAFEASEWERLIAVMLTGTALVTKALLPGMRQRGFGRVINIGSVHSLVASPFKSAYVAAKHGLLGLAKTIALENADFDFTCNTVCPAYVDTPLVRNQIADQAREHGLTPDAVVNDIMLEPMPKKAFISIEELAGVTEFLLSQAARNITAQTIVIDGGWTAK